MRLNHGRPEKSVAFREWFGDSKVVDARGEPLVVYHGTTAVFDVFDFNAGINAPVPQAVYFTDSLDLATYVSRMGWSRPGHVVAAYLRMTNPLVLDAEGAHAIAMTDEVLRRLRPRYQSDAYDGVILLNVREFQQDALTTTYAVFDPRQIKSATANVGTFDRSSPDITRNPSGRGGTGRRARLKIEFPYRSASSTLAAPTIHNPPIDLSPFHAQKFRYASVQVYEFREREPNQTSRRARNAVAQATLARHGYVTGRVLGSGRFATTYALASHPDRVAKITNDPVDAAAMAELIDAPRYIKGIPKVFEVFQLPEQFGGKDAFVIIVERLLPLSAQDAYMYREIEAKYMSGWRLAIGDLAGIRTYDEPLEKALVQGVLYLSSLGYMLGDVHVKNMMRRKDDSYVISDFGMSGVEPSRAVSKDIPIINPALRDTGTLALRVKYDDFEDGHRYVLYDTTKLKTPSIALVGYALVVERKDGNVAAVQVTAQRGYGPLMYALVAAHSGKPVVPSDQRSKAALGFWSRQPGEAVHPASEQSLRVAYGASLSDLQGRDVATDSQFRHMKSLGEDTALAAETREKQGKPNELPRDELIRFLASSHTTKERAALEAKLAKMNPRDLKGRSIPERYLAGLPREAKRRRTLELTISRDAYRLGDFSELPTDRLARSMGLVKQSAYSKVAEARGIEWRGDADDMARRVCDHYKAKCTPAVAASIRGSFNKGLAAWKSGGHRPGATAQNWAVARVNSLVVGGKTAHSADASLFKTFPSRLQAAILAATAVVGPALRKLGREDDASYVARRGPA